MHVSTMRNAIILGLAGVLIGCAAKTPVSPAQICLYGSSSRLLEAPPANAATLYEFVANRPGMVDAPKNTRDYWFVTNSGSLRLCRQRVEARNVCGSANVEFKMVDGRWRLQGPVDVAACDL